jgi:predicted metal-dependent HD superfamily phosphohydrolase
MEEQVIYSKISIVDKAEEFVRKEFSQVNNSRLVYHDINHTAEVVDTVKELYEKVSLTTDEKDMLLIAAWFHDVGYLYDYKNHEQRSAEICRQFLNSSGFPLNKTERILEMILATKMPQSPKNLPEEILCDADLSHTGKKGFHNRSLLLKEEWEKNSGRKFSDEEWIRKSISFLSSTYYFTPAAKESYSKQKEKNLIKLKNRLINMGTETSIPPSAETPLNEEVKTKGEKKTDRGIETMFRNTMRTHVEFSKMADNKANIMISVNTLILTAIVAVMSRKLDSNPHLIIPTAILTFISLATLIFATLVTRPKITSGRFNEDEIKQKKANLLFFGNFFNMDLKMFQWGMNEMMKDKEYLYGSMIKDFYYLGQVLGKKYRYLRICYNLFMYGIIITVIAFAIAVSLNPEGTNLGPLIE